MRKWTFNASSIVTEKLRVSIILGLIFKVLAGVLLGKVYLWLYNGGGDTFTMYQDAQYLAGIASADVVTYLDFFFFDDYDVDKAIYDHLLHRNPRAVLMVKLISCMIWLTIDNYWWIGALCSLFSYGGCVYFYLKICQLDGVNGNLVGLAFLVPTSFVIWTSGVFKEAILCGLLYSLLGAALGAIASVQKLGQRQVKNVRGLDWVSIVVFLLAVWPLFRLKYYYAAAIGVCILGYAVWVLSPSSWGRAGKVGVILLLSMVFIFGLGVLHPNLSLENIVFVIWKNNQIMAGETMKSENLILYIDYRPDIVSMVKNLPHVLWQAFWRPYLWEAGHIFKKLQAIEAMVLSSAWTGTLLYYIYRMRKGDVERVGVLAFLGIVFVLSMFILLTFASPNIGNLVRYKAPCLPIALAIMFHAWEGS